MKKILLIIFSLGILGCQMENYKSKAPPEGSIREQKVKSSLDEILKKLSMPLKQVYSNGETFNYHFQGNMDSPVQTFITGKDLVIPILYEEANSQQILTIAVLINLEKFTKQLLVDSLIIDYNQFKYLIQKSSSWIEKTENFNSNFVLEKSLSKVIEVSLPQNKSKKKFDSFMVFDGERRIKNLVLREQTIESAQTIISFQRNKILYMNDKLNDEYMLKSILDNYDAMNKEIEKLDKAYNELDSLINN